MVTQCFRLAAVVAACVVSTVVGGSAFASITLLDTQGFEDPLYTTTYNGTGELEGQPITLPVGESWHLSSASPGVSTANVQGTIFQSGSQAVAMQYNGVDSRWGVPIDMGGLESVTVSFGMRVDPSQTSSPTAPEFGPLYGVEAYSDSNGGATLLGSVYVDATTGEILYSDSNTGFFEIAPLVSTVPFGTFSVFDLVLDYTAQQFSLFVNGMLAVEDIGFFNGPATTFGSADLSTISYDGLDPAVSGTAYVDNFGITAVVPELSTGVIWLGLATVAAGGYWKRSRAAKS